MLGHRLILSRLTACLIPVICAGTIAPAGQPDTALQGLLDRLDAPNWSEREAATEALIAAEAIPMSSIERALSSSTISDEQRARLDLVSVERYRREPLAGLGVQFGNQAHGAVQINAVVPGFPAAELLRSGDTILSVGEDLRAGLIGGQQDLRAEILSRRPGELMPVLIRRGTQTLELDLPLGSYANLQGAAMLDDGTIRRAMIIRREREGGTATAPEPAVGSALDMAAWIAGGFPDGTWAGLKGGGERRDHTIVPAGASASLSERGRQSLLRSFWPSLEAALDESARQLLDRNSRAMTASIVLRGVYLEHERSLVERIGNAERDGREAPDLADTLESLREQLDALDEQMLAATREIESIRELVGSQNGD
ncbi:MAG: hypothetical protein AAGA55_02870 [Planctomycetota bacterium]